MSTETAAVVHAHNQMWQALTLQILSVSVNETSGSRAKFCLIQSRGRIETGNRIRQSLRMVEYLRANAQPFAQPIG